MLSIIDQDFSKFDKNLTIPKLVDHHLNNSKHHVFFRDDSNNIYKGLETHRAILRASQYIQDQVPSNDNVIAHLLENEPLTYSTIFKGCVTSGNIALALSNRNSVPAVVDLLKKTDCHYIIYSSTSIQLTQTVKAVKDELSKQGFELNLVESPSINLLFPKLGNEREEDLFNVQLKPLPSKFEDDNKVVVILHSSGTSSFPKPIAITNKSVRSWAIVTTSNFDKHKKRFWTGALPTFHAMGFFCQIICTLVTTMENVVFTPKFPPVFPTPEAILDSIKKTQANMVILVPSIIEEWANDPITLPLLQSLDLLMFGGAGLNDSVGDYLTTNNVKLNPCFGTTETGASSYCFYKRSGDELKDWSWVIPHEGCSLRFSGQDDLYELHYIENENHVPSVNNLDDVKGYNTGDMVRLHPTRNHWFKIVGRSDSQIMLSTGEKTNPEPMESIINEHPYIARSVMFGRGKTSNGVLIEPYENVKDPEVYLNDIWINIESANKHAPQHSRIQKSHVLICDLNKPLPVTPKGSVKRLAAYQLYEKEIEEVYTKTENDVIDTNVTIDKNNVLNSITNITKSVMNKDVELDVDLVSQGLDSLQATMIRNKLTSGLKLLNKNVNISSTVVFQYPKITLLSNYIEDVIKGNQISLSEDDKIKIKLTEIDNMIQRQVSKLKTKPSDGWIPPKVEGQSVLVTGTTGGLGAQLLVTLLNDPLVKKVYAVNRPNPSKSLKDRQIKSFEEKHISKDLIDSTKIELIEADLNSDNNLSLSDEIYSDIKNNVDVIIHNAWRVDFNVALQSFESDLNGLVNLTNLAITSKYGAALIFTSSIGSLARWPIGKPTVEEPLSDSSIAIGMGYGESKYVGERILSHASQNTGIPTTILRIGQMSGDRRSGFWSSSNWVPAIIKSALSLNCLPTGDDLVAWIPLDDAAESIIDFTHNRRTIGKTHDLLHVVHPKPISWNDVFEVIVNWFKSNGKDVKLVDYSHWIELLKKTDESKMVENPAIKLLPMFTKAAVSKDRRDFVEAMGNPLLETKRACAASQKLNNCPPLSKSDIEKWLNSWSKENFI